ncbi:MAG TPA: uroporphyrinogen decarboxylase family protein [Spirochaetia bacterium]|nr:uroporphyrinogen decarboxylase family protein [Spirochaetia bacterium]
MAHKEPDRVPVGEISIEAGFANRLLGASFPGDYQHYERDRRVRERLGLDYVNMGDWPAYDLGVSEQGWHVYRSAYGDQYAVTGHSRHMVRPLVPSMEEARGYRPPDPAQVTGDLVRAFAADNDLFVFGQVGGPVTILDECLGMEGYMIAAFESTAEIQHLSEAVMTFEAGKARVLLDAGADAILVGDDIAFNTGPFLPPRVMRQVVYPLYRWLIAEIKRHRAVPVLLHSDGQLMPVLDEIVRCGFQGLHSLQPSAGMDIGEIKRRYGGELTLMGNIDLDYVMTRAPASEVRDVVTRTVDIAAPGGGFILGTCNALIEAVPDANAWALYETGRVHPVYSRSAPR